MPMKKSRVGAAILFLIFVVVVFVAVAVVLSVVTDREDDESLAGGIFDSGNKIGVVPVEGTITSSDKVLKQLKKFGKKSSIKAVVLRINSPGGAVAPAQEIYREISKIKKKKPVVASMESVGASAAYYIASNADRIVCSRGTITGSIGVILILTEIRKVIEKIGVNVTVIKAGKYKDMGVGIRPLTEDERKLLDSFAKEIHEQFIKDVAAGRKGKIDMEKLRTIADGSFFSGRKAKELGLVDPMGNFYDAVKIAGKLGGVEGEPELVYPKKKWDSYLDFFLESGAKALAKAVERSNLIQNTPAVR